MLPVIPWTKNFEKLRAIQSMHIQNVPGQNVPRQNVPRQNVPGTKRPKGQNVPRDKTSQGDK